MDAFVEHLNAVLPDAYRVEGEVGAGGMATVYRALDVRHDRQVAVKVLRPELAAVVGAERFLTEIRVTASLQHPHILPLHDSGEADGLLYYVMPFVPGESLRDRLERETQLPVEEALRITREVADGLGHAHELGVIHRDVKPENILLTGEHALVADFGIARAVSEAGGSRITETGITLGTPPYMSPEQATAEANVDARSDQYSLACVLYEMLVGEPPFTGPTARAVMAKVLTQRPAPVRESRELVDAGVDAAVQKALAKLPADRFPTVRDFAERLRDPAALLPTQDAPGPYGGRRRSRSRSEVVAWALVTMLATAVTVLLLRAARPDDAEGVTRMVLDPRPAEAVAVGAHLVPTELGAEVDVLAISADGRRIAFVGRGADGETRIYLRELGAYEARALPETESSTSPFFSPDGDWVGFYSWPDRRLKRLPVSGGPPQVICQCEPILSADWGPDGTVVMDSWGLEGLRVVPASGGVPEGVGPQETMEADEYALSHPDFLPDGRHVLVTAWGGGGSNRRIAAVAVDEGGRTTLLDEGWTPHFAVDGQLVYQRANQLWAVPFDAGALEVRGTPVPVLDSVFSATFTTIYALSATGTLVYGPGPVPSMKAGLELVDVSGQREGLTMEGGEWDVTGPQLSPSEDRIVFAGSDAAGYSGGQASSRLWVLDRERGRVRALTDEGPGDFWPLWAPDGRTVVFTSLRGGGIGIHSVPADGSEAPRPLISDGAVMQAHSWLPDGRGLVFQRRPDGESDFDVWLLPTTDGGPAEPLVEGPSNELHPAVSPDGRWLAYASDRSGRFEIYVRPYPALDREVQVSRAGGMGPLWGADGRALYFYRTGPESDSEVTFLRAPVDPDPGLPEPVWSHPSPSALGSRYGKGYDVTADGRQLLVAALEVGFPTFLPELRIIFGWDRELGGRFGG